MVLVDISGGRLQLARRLRLPALFCALAVLGCVLVSRPYVSMGVCDDGPYILMAQKLAATGQFAYNGWAAPMIGWQLYLGAAFVKLFGFSFTAVRFSTVLVAMALAFLLQRTLVLAGITERNATLGTLAFVLSPLYLMLSVTYMTDIFGLFAIVICLYGCLHALQSPTQRSTILWLCFAVVSNAVFGTARQIAWLGILILVPSTLWLLRAQRRVLLIGAIANFAAVLFMIGCLQWLKHQPYVIPERLVPDAFPVGHLLGQLTYLFLDAPFLLLPLFAIFLPELGKAPRRILVAIVAVFGGYFFLALYPSHLRGNFPLEPMLFNGNWVSVHGIYEGVVSLSDWHSITPLFLHTGARIVLTIASLGGLAGLLVSLFRTTASHHATLRSRGEPSPSCWPPLLWCTLSCFFPEPPALSSIATFCLCWSSQRSSWSVTTKSESARSSPAASHFSWSSWLSTASPSPTTPSLSIARGSRWPPNSTPRVSLTPPSTTAGSTTST